MDRESGKAIAHHEHLLHHGWIWNEDVSKRVMGIIGRRDDERGRARARIMSISCRGMDGEPGRTLSKSGTMAESQEPRVRNHEASQSGKQEKQRKQARGWGRNQHSKGTGVIATVVTAFHIQM